MTVSQQNPQKSLRRYLSSSAVTKTSAFLLPTLEIPYGVIKNYGFKNAYIGDKRIPSDTYPAYSLYLLFEHEDSSKLEEVASALREYPNYIDEYDPSPNKMVIVMQMKQRWQHLLQIFMQGRYSDFDEEYISKNYPKRIYAGVDPYGNPVTKESINHMVLTRDEVLKQEIEEDLKVTLEDVYDKISGTYKKYQLMSKPSLDTEILT